MLHHTHHPHIARDDDDDDDDKAFEITNYTQEKIQQAKKSIHSQGTSILENQYGLWFLLKDVINRHCMSVNYCSVLEQESFTGNNNLLCVSQKVNIFFLKTHFIYS